LLGVAILYSSCNSSKKAVNKNGDGDNFAEKDKVKFEYHFFNASKEKVLGNYELALNLFLQCAKINPKEPTPLYEIANIYDQTGDIASALPFAERATQLNPDNYWFQLLYGQLLYKNNNVAKCIKVFETLYEKNPQDLELAYNLAGIYIYENKHREAISLLDRIETQMGISEEISYQKQQLYLKLNDVEGAVSEIKKLILAFPSETKYYGVLGDIYFTNGQEENALEVYQKVLKIDPEAPFVHLSLADYYRKKGQKALSYEHLILAFKNSELNIDSKMQILLSYYSLSNANDNLKKQAFELCEILIATHPNEAKSHSIYGDFLYRDGQLNEAKVSFKKSLALEQNLFPIWNQILVIDIELSDFTSLVEDGKQTIELFPNQPTAYFFYGYGLVQKKDYTKAVEILSAGKDMVFNNDELLSQFFSTLGEAYYRIKKYTESDNAFENALRKNPNDATTLNNYSYYLSERGDKLEKAAEMSAKSNNLQPGQPSYLDTYGWILYKQKKYTEAKEWLKKALDSGGGGNSTILEHYGDVLFQLGEIENAIAYWKKAEENGGASEKLKKKIADKNIYE
jgi:tetratricopeptide (TPR) repeat protein